MGHLLLTTVLWDRNDPAGIQELNKTKEGGKKKGPYPKHLRGGTQSWTLKTLQAYISSLCRLISAVSFSLLPFCAIRSSVKTS